MYFDYIQDMVDSAEKAIKFVGNMKYNQFSEDDKTTFAGIRALEIIGEAAKKVPTNATTSRRIWGIKKEFPDQEKCK